MKTCPACRKHIHVRATKCPYCQSLFDGAQMEVGRREHSARRLRKMVIVGVSVVILVYLFFRNLTAPGMIEALAEREARASVNRD